MERYVGKRVKIVNTNKTEYLREGLIGKEGCIVKVYEDNLGVKMDDKTNEASSVGVYWFKLDDVKLLGEDSQYITDEDFVNQMYEETLFANDYYVNLLCK